LEEPLLSVLVAVAREIRRDPPEHDLLRRDAVPAWRAAAFAVLDLHVLRAVDRGGEAREQLVLRRRPADERAARGRRRAGPAAHPPLLLDPIERPVEPPLEVVRAPGHECLAQLRHLADADEIEELLEPVAEHAAKESAERGRETRVGPARGHLL